MARPGHLPEFYSEVTRRLFAAGLAWQDTVAITANPLVRCRIKNVLDDLDEAVKFAGDYVFGREPALSWDNSDGEADYWLQQSELALDLAATALVRAGEVNGDWGQDAAATLRSKLAMLRESVNAQ